MTLLFFFLNDSMSLSHICSIAPLSFLEHWECWLFPTSPLNIYSGAIKWRTRETFGCRRLLIGDQKIHRLNKYTATRVALNPPHTPPRRPQPPLTAVRFYFNSVLSLIIRLPGFHRLSVRRLVTFDWQSHLFVIRIGGSLWNGRVASMQGDPVKAISTAL